MAPSAASRLAASLSGNNSMAVYSARGAAVKLEERDGPWGQFMAKTIADWHRSGKLIELEKKWNIAPSAFLKNASAQLK